MESIPNLFIWVHLGGIKKIIIIITIFTLGSVYSTKAKGAKQTTETNN